jgi:hypothetical protein
VNPSWANAQFDHHLDSPTLGGKAVTQVTRHCDDRHGLFTGL